MVKFTENQRLKILREYLKMSQKEFSEAINLQQGSYSDVERGKASVSRDLMIKLISIFNLNAMWFYSGKGPMLMQEENNDTLSDSKKEYTEKIWSPKWSPKWSPNPKSTQLGDHAIPLVTQRAYGGEPGGFADLSGDDPPLLMLPNMPRGRELIAIQVYGDSMSPSISQGDILVTAKVENTLTIKPGKVYVVCVLHNGASVKRLEYIDDLSLHFTSDNPGSPGLTVYKEDIAQMWEWVAQITNWEPSAPTDNLYEISAQFHHLRSDVDRILKRLDLEEKPV